MESWLDLSTGINPNGWPVPQLPATAWQRLPEREDDLEQAAREYYRTPDLLPVAGSQAAIQALPRLRAPCRVGVITPGYGEHALAWERAGHRVRPLIAGKIDTEIDYLDVLVVINPNNPTGVRFSREQLLHWHSELADRNGWLVVDEAFMDATPEQSIADQTHLPGLIVLRSLGKFFGLAGARVGFVSAQPELLAHLNDLLGPWTINGPARWIATATLRDHAWQAETRQRLQSSERRLKKLLTKYELPPSGGCGLIQWCLSPEAAELHQQLARQGILTRLFSQPASLRFGLPGDEAEWQKVETALSHLAVEAMA
jgi:cobalamin biosynthetic protein CobC